MPYRNTLESCHGRHAPNYLDDSLRLCRSLKRAIETGIIMNSEKGLEIWVFYWTIKKLQFW